MSILHVFFYNFKLLLSKRKILTKNKNKFIIKLNFYKKQVKPLYG